MLDFVKFRGTILLLISKFMAIYGADTVLGFKYSFK